MGRMGEGDLLGILLCLSKFGLEGTSWWLEWVVLFLSLHGAVAWKEDAVA